MKDPCAFVDWLVSQGLPTMSLRHGDAGAYPIDHALFLLRSPSSLTSYQRGVLQKVAAGVES